MTWPASGTSSNSHSVAVRSGCTNIPRAAGGAQEDGTILIRGFSSQPWNRFVHLDLPGLISVSMTAARSPPRSEPANSHDFRPSAIARSFCPCRAGVGSPLPVSSIFRLQGLGASRRAASDGPILSCARTGRHRGIDRRLDARSCDLRWNDNRRAARRSGRTHRVGAAIDTPGQPRTLPERCRNRSGGRQ